MLACWLALQFAVPELRATSTLEFEDTRSMAPPMPWAETPSQDSRRLFLGSPWQITSPPFFKTQLSLKELPEQPAMCERARSTHRLSWGARTDSFGERGTESWFGQSSGRGNRSNTAAVLNMQMRYPLLVRLQYVMSLRSPSRDVDTMSRESLPSTRKPDPRSCVGLWTTPFYKST